VILAAMLTAANPYAHAIIAINQMGGGAHINLLGNPIAQIVFVTFGIYASVQLLSPTKIRVRNSLLLACMGLGTCSFSALTIMLTWFGIGSHYSIEKCMFFTVAITIFVVSANAVLRSDTTELNCWKGSIFGAFGCAVLALAATRIDLIPSVVNLKTVIPFEVAVRNLPGLGIDSDGKYNLVISKKIPPNVVYAINIGDLKVSAEVAGFAIFGQSPPIDQVKFALMQTDDPDFSVGCMNAKHSTPMVAVVDYACLQRSKP
jgi:hypothetical protein